MITSLFLLRPYETSYLYTSKKEGRMDNVAIQQPDASAGERYWEIDAIRGFAILGMLFFHSLAMLMAFHIIEETPEFMQYYNLYVFGTAVFVLLAGVSMILRHERMQKKGLTDREYYVTLVNRAILLFGIAMLITVATWIGDAIFFKWDACIKFGFIHMLAVSMLIAVPLLRFRKWNILFGVIIIAIGAFIIPHFTSPPWLFPLGIHGPDFLAHTQDYFPLFPWAGVLFLGVGLGNIFYPNGVRGFTLKYKPGHILQWLAKIGQGSVTLFIYLVHVPVLFVIVWIFSVITGIGYI